MTATSAVRTKQTKPVASEPSLLRWAWITVPIHLALGVLVWWMMLHATDHLADLLLWIHVGFPVVCLLTVAWWWHRWGELVALLTINHLATFSVLICLPWS